MLAADLGGRLTGTTDDPVGQEHRTVRPWPFSVPSRSDFPEGARGRLWPCGLTSTRRRCGTRIFWNASRPGRATPRLAARGVPKCTDTARHGPHHWSSRSRAVLQSEVTMSKLNGDKARFQRLRKAKLRRRERTREIRATIHSGATRIRPGSDGERSGGVRGRVGTLRPTTEGSVAE